MCIGLLGVSNEAIPSEAKCVRVELALDAGTLQVNADEGFHTSIATVSVLPAPFGSLGVTKNSSRWCAS